MKTIRKEIFSCLFVVGSIYAFVLNLHIAFSVYDIFMEKFHSYIFALFSGICSFFGLIILCIYILYLKDKQNNNQIELNRLEQIELQYNILKNNIPKYKNEIIKRNTIISQLNTINKNNNVEFWKNKYDEIDKKYKQANDEAIYFRHAYEKEHSKLVALEKELSTSSQNDATFWKDKYLQYINEFSNSNTLQINSKLVEYWQNVCKEKSQKIDKLKKIILSSNHSTENDLNTSTKILSGDVNNIWKNKYEEINRKYNRANDEVIYFRRAYDKEHAKLALLEKKLSMSRQEIAELKEKLIKKYTVEDIENISDWRNFEQFIAEQFKNKGFKVILTPQTNDGGKDIIIEKDGVKTYIECKYWNKNKSIGREEIQKLAGATMMDGIKNALFITTSIYNENAIEAAKALNQNGFNIKLWTTESLLKFINN